MAPLAKRKRLPVARHPRFVWRAGNTGGLGSMSSLARALRVGQCDDALTTDRKSTRLNSSHQIISYGVFCLEKKKEIYIAVDTGLSPRTQWSNQCIAIKLS